jgi:hypothetical protein
MDFAWVYFLDPSNPTETLAKFQSSRRSLSTASSQAHPSSLTNTRLSILTATPISHLACCIIKLKIWALSAKNDPRVKHCGSSLCKRPSFHLVISSGVRHIPCQSMHQMTGHHSISEPRKCLAFLSCNRRFQVTLCLVGSVRGRLYDRH